MSIKQQEEEETWRLEMELRALENELSHLNNELEDISSENKTIKTQIEKQTTFKSQGDENTDL